jgi:hypothetical protein
VDGDAGFDRWQLGEAPNEWKSRTCPRRIVTSESDSWLQLFSLYKSGHLLVAGGVIDQPAIYLHAMTLIESLISQARSNQ